MELGKQLATQVRSKMNEKRTHGEMLVPADGFNPSTTTMLNKYLEAGGILRTATRTQIDAILTIWSNAHNNDSSADRCSTHLQGEPS